MREDFKCFKIYGFFNIINVLFVYVFLSLFFLSLYFFFLRIFENIKRRNYRWCCGISWRLYYLTVSMELNSIDDHHDHHHCFFSVILYFSHHRLLFSGDKLNVKTIHIYLFYFMLHKWLVTQILIS